MTPPLGFAVGGSGGISAAYMRAIANVPDAALAALVSRNVRRPDALLYYPSGMIGTFCASTICKPGFPTRLEVHAQAGPLMMENDQISSWQVEGIANPPHQTFEVHDGATSALVSDTAGHEKVIQDFVSAVRQERLPAESGRMTTKLVLQI